MSWTTSASETVPETMKNAWVAAFGGDVHPTGFVVAPGRVNLIGEHVDHQGYSVFPCAIHLALRMLVRRERRQNAVQPALRIEHVLRDVYPGRVFAAPEDLVVNSADRSWLNYVAAAYLGVVEFYRSAQNPNAVGAMFEPSLGLKSGCEAGVAAEEELSPAKWVYHILVEGDVPAAAGLSSSAALVVGTTMALEPSLGAVVRADLCARAERYSGVASGGMDQAAILLSEAGAATHVAFSPLTPTLVTLPKNTALVIANTCREAPKAVSAATMYNRRVFELKAACMLLLPAAERDAVTPAQLLELQLRDVVRRLNTTESVLLADLADRLPLVQASRCQMRAAFCSADEATELSRPPAKGTPEDWMPQRMRVLLETRCGMDVWTKNETFVVQPRVRHVLSEAMRVADFLSTAQSATLCDDEKMERMGFLMNLSGESLRSDFECSCAEIDTVVEIARKHGALGARLTGAGWGGCVVALVHESKKDDVLNGIRKEYFAPAFKGELKVATPLEKLPKSEDAVAEALFFTAPSAGAAFATVATA